MENTGSVYCPICGSTFDEFAEHGKPARPNARCHKCRSLERHRLVYLYLSGVSSIFRNTYQPVRVLHFAPHRLFYNIFDKLGHVAYIPVDIAPERYNFNGNSPVVKADIMMLPFMDNSFDFILCNHVLEHIPDDRLAMSEMYRVMAPGGFGIFQVPMADIEKTYEDWNLTTPEEREKAFGQHDHVRWYGHDYPERLESVGFKVHEKTCSSMFSEAEIARFALTESENVYHVVKE